MGGAWTHLLKAILWLFRDEQGREQGRRVPGKAACQMDPYPNFRLRSCSLLSSISVLPRA